MDVFFAPPPDPAPAQAPWTNSPPWLGRPQGRPPGEVLSDLVLAESDTATVSIAYLDAFPDGFELAITALARVPYADLARPDDSADVFGRHWPRVEDARGTLPPQLLRVGVQYADGRRASTVAGHSRPLDGPVIAELSGGGQGRGGHGADPESRFHQGYWISPLPGPGVLTVLCEWPALDIPLSRQEIDAGLILAAAERSRELFGEGLEVRRDGREWTLGTSADVAFITEQASAQGPVGIAIPPSFAAYATLRWPDAEAELAEHEQAILELLREHTNAQPWWLGYLDTGASDVVFPYAPRVKLHYGHPYVLIQAGPDQAGTWRTEGWNLALPDLMFPADHAWLLSGTWDEDWTCLGGSERFIDSLLGHPVLGPRAERAG